MRVIFIGIVSIGWHFLKELLEIGANVVGIFTADKQEMVGLSGMHPDYFSEFGDLALKYNVPLFKVNDVSVPLDVEKIEQLQPDIIFVIGWPQIIGRRILRIPKNGCIGIHPTLLPKRRGGAPINWTLIDGLTRSGISLFYFTEGVDSGDIIVQEEFDISIEDNAKTVLDKATDITVGIIKRYYPLLEMGKAPRIPQKEDEATYTKRRHPEDGVIDWKRTSLSIYNLIRALSLPFPPAFTYWQGKRIAIMEVRLIKGHKPYFHAKAGEIIGLIDEDIIVGTGDDCILIKSLEADGRQMSGIEFMQKYNIGSNELFGVV